MNRVLRRYCETRFQCEVEKLKAVREADRKRRQTDGIARALRAKKRKIDAEKKERQNAAKEELERQREKLSKAYRLEDVQGDDKVSKKNRLDLLERLKLGSPALPPKLEVEWPRIKEYIERYCMKEKGHLHGSYLLNNVNKVLEKLGKHYQRNTLFKANPTAESDMKYFKRWVEYFQAKMPKPTVAPAIC